MERKVAEIKKKILIFSPAIYPCSIGGLEVFNYYLAIELAKTKSLIVATSCKKGLHRTIETMKLLNRLFIVKRFGLSKFSLIISGFFLIARRHNHIGVIHVPYTSSTGFLGILFILTKKILKIPYIIYIHGGGMRPWRNKLLQRLFFKHADRIIAVSEIIKNEYEKRTGNEIQVILPLIPFIKSVSNKIDLKTSFGLNADDKIILVVGSIKPLKGSEIILKSFINLGIEFVKNERLKLLFVGDGQQRKVLESRVFEYQGFDEHIRFWGNLPNDKLPDVYAIANIYVIASWFEGTPKTLLEAMYNGLPIIGSNVNGINNIIFDRKNGLLFEKNNNLQLSEQIKYLIQNEETAAKLGMNAQANNVNKFDYTQMVHTFEDLYNCYLL